MKKQSNRNVLEGCLAFAACWAIIIYLLIRVALMHIPLLTWMAIGIGFLGFVVVSILMMDILPENVPLVKPLVLWYWQNREKIYENQCEAFRHEVEVYDEGVNRREWDECLRKLNHAQEMVSLFSEKEDKELKRKM